MTATTKSKPKTDTAEASPPLLKTCVMCRTRKVKCGSEKPSCHNCIKYRCQCVYLPPVRYMRTHPSGVSKPAAHQNRTSRDIQKMALASNSLVSADPIDGFKKMTPPPTDLLLQKDSSSISCSTASSIIGSPPLPPNSYSPGALNTGVDIKQIEASLPASLPDTLDNMLKAYFRYQYPSSGIVQEEFFWFRYHRNMLTPLIIYGMLAVAAWNLASDHGSEEYILLHEIFYRTAKQFVEDAMDEAHLRSVQGLLVLANYEALVGRWAAMWNHTTVARRLAEGITFRNEDFPWFSMQGQRGFDFEWQRVQRAYWHSLINDIQSCVLMDKQVGGIEIQLPAKPTLDFTYRTARMVGTETGYRVITDADADAHALEDPQYGNTAATGELFLLVGAISNAAYLFDHARKPPLFETFIDFELRLAQWYTTLPDTVRLDDSTIQRFTRTAQRADLGEIISTHMFWNFARLLLMKMGLVLSLKEDTSMLRNIYDNRAFFTTDSRALQFYQSEMPILTPDKAASYDQWLFHFCRCMSLQSAQNIVNLLKLAHKHDVHPGHFGAGVILPLVQVVSVSLGLVHSPDPQVVQIAVDHLATITRTLLRLKNWFNTAQLLLHLFVAIQDPQLVLPPCAVSSEPTDAVCLCPFPPAHLITELMRRLGIGFEDFVKQTIQAVRVSSLDRNRMDPCISPLLRHLPEQPLISEMEDTEPDWFKYAPGYLRAAWKRLERTYKK